MHYLSRSFFLIFLIAAIPLHSHFSSPWPAFASAAIAMCIAGFQRLSLRTGGLYVCSALANLFILGALATPYRSYAESLCAFLAVLSIAFACLEFSMNADSAKGKTHYESSFFSGLCSLMGQVGDEIVDDCRKLPWGWRFAAQIVFWVMTLVAPVMVFFALPRLFAFLALGIAYILAFSYKSSDWRRMRASYAVFGSFFACLALSSVLGTIAWALTAVFVFMTWSSGLDQS